MRLILSLREPQGHVMNSALGSQVLVVGLTAPQPCNSWDVEQVPLPLGPHGLC